MQAKPKSRSQEKQVKHWARLDEHNSDVNFTNRPFRSYLSDLPSQVVVVNDWNALFHKDFEPLPDCLNVIINTTLHANKCICT